MADVIKVVKLGDVTYEINGKYIQGTDGSGKTWEDIVALSNSAKLDLVVVSSLPAASVDTMAKIYLVAEEGAASGTYVEYVTLRSGSEGSYTYSWERIGTTQADLSGKADKGTYTSVSNGAHEHTVSGNVTIPTVTPTSKHLTVSITDAAVAGSGTAAAITALGDATTGNALPADATFNVTGGEATTANIGATASGTAVGANGTVSAITDLGTTTSGTFLTGLGEVSTADALPADATFNVTGGVATNTNIKATASGTALSTDTASFVKSYPGATTNLKTASITPVGGTTTVPGSVSVTAGSAAAWSASVASDGTLSFSFTANTPTAVTVGANKTVATSGTAATVVTGLDANGTGGTVMTGLGTAVTGSALTSASVATQPTIALSTGATAGAGVISVTTGVSAVGVTASGTAVSAITDLGTATTATAITALGTPSKSTVLTGVKVTAQPTIALATGATAGTGVVSVVTGVSGVGVTASGTAVKAITGFGAHTTANVLTGVKVSTQPTVALADTATAGGVTFVSDVTIGTTTAALTGGKAASAGAHTHDTTI